MDGNEPSSNLIVDAAGNLYGTTLTGGSHGVGTVFELSPTANGNWTEKILHSFSSGSGDGYYPYAGLIFDSSNNFHGTTGAGGVNAGGTVFEIVP